MSMIEKDFTGFIGKLRDISRFTPDGLTKAFIELTRYRLSQQGGTGNLPGGLEKRVYKMAIKLCRR